MVVPQLVDTHCHLDLFSNYAEVIRVTESAQIQCIAVTNTPSVFSRMEELVGGCRYVLPALGLHPELASSRAAELPIFLKALSRTRYIGEVGLDYTTTVASERHIQRRVFSEILSACDASGDKILTIHSRRAVDDVLDAIGQSFRGSFILHWYSGSRRSIKRAVERGAYFSVNPAMLRSQNGRRLVAAVPRERILTESDGPFVTVDTGPATPASVDFVVAGLAALWETEKLSAQSQTYDNFLAISATRS